MNFLFLLVGFFPTFWNVARGPAHERLGWVRRRGQWPLQWALRRRHGGPSLLLLLLMLLLLLLLMSLLLLPDGVAQSHPFLRFVCVSVLVCVVRVRWFLSLWKRWIIVDIKNRLASIDCIMGRRYNTTKPCFYRIFPIVSLRKKKLRLWRWSDRRSGDQRWRVLIFSSWFSFRIICFIFLLFHAARFLFNRCHVIFRLQPRVLFLI